MRQSVGTTTLFQIVLAFTLLFSAFLAVAITYNKVFKLKNETIAIIEKYEGISSTSLEIINNYLKNNGHDTKGHCPEGSYGVTDLDSEALELTNSSKKYRYCISYEKNTFKNCTYIFKIRVFYDFNLPLLGRVRKFNVNGQTNELNIAYMNGKLLPC